MKRNQSKNDFKLTKKLDLLMYDLIFDFNTDEYVILISHYIKDIYKYDRFIGLIKQNLSKAEVLIVKECINTLPNEVIWKIKIRR